MTEKLTAQVKRDGDKLYFQFQHRVGTTNAPKENVESFAIQALHSLAILQAKDLLTYATELKPDAKVEISDVTPASN